MLPQLLPQLWQVLQQLWPVLQWRLQVLRLRRVLLVKGLQRTNAADVVKVLPLGLGS